MSYTIDYSGLDEMLKAQHAIDDIQSYLGTEAFCNVQNSIMAAFRGGATDEEVAMSLHFFGGISGYPVTAWLASIREHIAHQAES